MMYTPVTPFRRPVDSGLMKLQNELTKAALPPEGVNKWEALREISVAQAQIGVNDRALAVLQALFSFHKDTILGGNSADLVVYPSNKAICDRLNGMPCSTMRRHLGVLIKAGLLIRRDSPNGKRFARNYGDEKQVFGFDLTPIVVRFAEICVAAEQVRAAKEAQERLRRSVSLMRRDLASLANYGLEIRPDAALWLDLSELAMSTARMLRRKLTSEDLEAIAADLEGALDRARAVIDGKTQIMSTNDAKVEQHHQNSNKETYVSELCLENAKGKGGETDKDDHETNDPSDDPYLSDHNLPNIPLGVVLKACLEFKTFVPDQVHHWHDLVRAADILRPMMGISTSAWNEAVQAMGPEEAAVVVIAMLERTAEIRSPGGYLRHLSSKASMGKFSCGPMVMSLLNRNQAA